MKSALAHVIAKEGGADLDALETLDVVREVIDLEGSPLLRVRMAYEISRRYMEQHGLLAPPAAAGRIDPKE
ncbi:MAG: hypothetical protein HY423_10710 [Candidatus Lambdaproteobacteria bacterium]|nr:hypothetical protein [Candidatus Lambdaproteobacteria bacterium]